MCAIVHDLIWISRISVHSRAHKNSNFEFFKSTTTDLGSITQCSLGGPLGGHISCHSGTSVTTKIDNYY